MCFGCYLCTGVLWALALPNGVKNGLFAPFSVKILQTIKCTTIMPKRQFFLDHTQNHLVELSWKPFWKDLMVILNGKKIHIFPNREKLEDGQKFTLEDGRQLSVRLVNGDLETRLQWVLVPGSDEAPGGALWRTFQPSMATGVLAALFGVLMVFGRIYSEADPTIGVVFIGAGILTCVLSVIAYFSKSIIVFVVFIAFLFILSLLFSQVMLLLALLPIAVIIQILRKSFKELKKLEIKVKAIDEFKKTLQ